MVLETLDSSEAGNLRVGSEGLPVARPTLSREPFASRT